MRNLKVYLSAPILLLFVIVATGLATSKSFARPAAVFPPQEKDEPTNSSSSQWPPKSPAVKVSPIEAMKAAKLKLGGGIAFSANFEFDEGHWVYGVMAVKNHRLYEIEVNPITGKVVDLESASPEGEAKELREDLTKILAGR